MVLQRVRKRGSYLCVEEQKARETPGVCEVLWKMVTENSLWGSMLYKCITILTLQILKLDVKQHSLAQSSIYVSKRVKNVGDREKNNTQPLSLKSLKLRWRRHKFMKRHTGQHKQCMNTKWGRRQEEPSACEDVCPWNWAHHQSLALIQL